ncbi:MAG: hypothetical protein ABFD29_01940 [Anaerolineaceae bacterium]
MQVEQNPDSPRTGFRLLDGMDAIALISMDDIWSAMRIRPAELVKHKKSSSA